MKRKLSELHTDPRLLGIRKINKHVVSDYSRAMKRGDIFPPLVITSDGSIVSGNHRYQSYINVFEEDYKVEVVVRKYNTWADILLDFGRENATHGLPMGSHETNLLIDALMKAGAKEETIIETLNVPIQRVVNFDGIRVNIIGKKGGTINRMPVKSGLKGSVTEMTETQYTEHCAMDLGRHFIPQAQQIARWLNNDYIDFTNEHNLEALRTLVQAIERTHIPEPLHKAG